MPNVPDLNTLSDATIWPPPPSADEATPAPKSTPQSFTVAGIDFQATEDRVVVDNPRIRTVSVLFWIWQATVLAGTAWIQYQSMLWFQNVWGFRGTAVLLQVAMQAVVWIAMATAYVLFDLSNYKFNCRFQATFDRAEDQYLEAKHAVGSLGRIISIEVRGRSTFFVRRYEVRLLLSKASHAVEIDRRAIEERCLATFRSELDAHKLAEALAEFLGAGVRRTG